MALRVASLNGIKVPRAVKVAMAAVFHWRSYRLRGNMRLGPEDKIHIAIMGYIRVYLVDGAIAVHMPSEANRGPAWWAKLMAMGYINGVPDIIIFHASRAFFIEVKAESSLSTDQEGFRDWATSCGFPWLEARAVGPVSAFLTANGLHR